MTASLAGAAQRGTLLGTIPDGETLAGWEIIATGDGGAIAMKSGSCWSRYDGWSGDADAAWDALTARLWARMSDAEIRARLEENRARLAAAKQDGGRMKIIGAQAALEITYREAAKRGLAA